MKCLCKLDSTEVCFARIEKNPSLARVSGMLYPSPSLAVLPLHNGAGAVHAVLPRSRQTILLKALRGGRPIAVRVQLSHDSSTDGRR